MALAHLKCLGEPADATSPVNSADCSGASAKALLDELLDLHRRMSSAGSTSSDVGAARTLIGQAIGRLTPQNRDVGGKLARWQILAVDRLIATSIAEKIHIATLAQACRLSEAHFSRAFRATRGITPMRYVFGLRIHMAEELLIEGGSNLCAIAIACGFADQAHFTRVFRTYTGETPKRWQRRVRPSADTCIASTATQ